VLTIILLALVTWWLWLVALRLSIAPTKDSAGNVLDQYQRAKDILLVILPLSTTALGYWFGVQGKDKAEAQAETANAQLTAVVDAAPEGTLKDAMEKHPKAFGL
jgi:hypothetical protein